METFQGILASLIEGCRDRFIVAAAGTLRLPYGYLSEKSQPSYLHLSLSNKPLSDPEFFGDDLGGMRAHVREFFVATVMNQMRC